MAATPTRLRPPEESQEVAWFGWADAAAITEPCTRGIVSFLTPTG